MHVHLDSHLGVFKYLHDCSPKKKAPEMSFPVAVLRWECYFLYIYSTSLVGIFMVFGGGVPQISIT